MGKELRFPDDAPDPKVASALRPLLTPPSDTPAYWDGLQRRVMARIASAGAPSTWWALSPTAMRAGLIAAGLALLALGALALQQREIESRVAFQAVTDSDLEIARIIPGIDEPIVRTQQQQQPQRTPDSSH